MACSIMYMIVSLRKKEPASHSNDSDIASFIAAFLNFEKKTSCFRMIITAESWGPVQETESRKVVLASRNNMSLYIPKTCVCLLLYILSWNFMLCGKSLVMKLNLKSRANCVFRGGGFTKNGCIMLCTYFCTFEEEKKRIRKGGQMSLLLSVKAGDALH